VLKDGAGLPEPRLTVWPPAPPVGLGVEVEGPVEGLIVTTWPGFFGGLVLSGAGVTVCPRAPLVGRGGTVGRSILTTCPEFVGGLVLSGAVVAVCPRAPPVVRGVDVEGRMVTTCPGLFDTLVPPGAGILEKLAPPGMVLTGPRPPQVEREGWKLPEPPGNRAAGW
jgi:hypothetical protein